MDWAHSIRKSRNGLKKKLMNKLENLIQMDRTDENMAELIDTKVKLNWEINKEEAYWE